MSDDIQRDLGRLEAQVSALQKTVESLEKDIKALLAVVNQTKGGWKTLVMISAVAGTAGALIAKILPFIPWR